MTTRRPSRDDNAITDIIPFNEFGDLPDLAGDLGFSNCSAFDRESRVMHAPELDDLHDTDDLVPLRLVVPTRFQPTADQHRPSGRAYRSSHTDVSEGIAATEVIDMTSRRGVHRKPDNSAVKARLVAAAMAAGATAAAAYSVVNSTDTPHEATMLAAGQSAFTDGGVHHRLGRRHADRHGRPRGGDRLGAHRRDPEGLGIRPGAGRARGAGWHGRCS